MIFGIDRSTQIALGFWSKAVRYEPCPGINVIALITSPQRTAYEKKCVTV
jgi:hypothetical protein